MNINQNNKSEGQNMERLKEIPKWTRRYTENRTLPFLVFMATFMFLSLAIFGSSYLGGKACRSGNMVLFCICISITMLVCVVTAIFSVPKWGGKFIERISRRLYGREGDVKLALPEKTKKQRLIGSIVGLLFGTCVLISVTLGVLGFIPIEYMQPVSALYVIPFFVCVGIWQRPAVNPAGFLVWLWPGLYAIHAILVMAGVPIQFGGPWIFLNMLIPIAGYGILCGLIGHIYSRYALKKLKGIAHLEGEAANGD